MSVPPDLFRLNTERARADLADAALAFVRAARDAEDPEIRSKLVEAIALEKDPKVLSTMQALAQLLDTAKLFEQLDRECGEQ